MEWEPAARLSVFLSVFAIMAVWEALRPRRIRALSRFVRWRNNLSLVVIDTLIVRLLFPIAAVGAALDARAEGWGLFNHLSLPMWLELILVFAILDFAIWAQHVLFHHAPLLWRFHMVHHADRDMDVTTGLRFHPVEIAASMLIKIGLVYALGAPALGVILFEIVLNATAMWSHSNVLLPARIERMVRWVLVTPDMHRTHHSVERREHDSNFGFCFSFWDRLFRQYTETPAKGQDGVEIGLSPWRDGRSARLIWSLALPFNRRA